MCKYNNILILDVNMIYKRDKYFKDYIWRWDKEYIFKFFDLILNNM